MDIIEVAMYSFSQVRGVSGSQFLITEIGQ
jgi:hypothetical protein